MRSPSSLPEREPARLVAYVPQRPLYPRGMSVFDYVLLGKTPYMGALAQRAPVLVLDEATASLDLSAQHEVLELIDTLRGLHGMTVVSAIHDLTAAGQFCDRVALITDGSLRRFGSPVAVLTEPLLQEVFESSIRVIEIDGDPVIVSLRSEEQVRE